MISYAQYNPVGVVPTSTSQNLCWARVFSTLGMKMMAYSILASIHPMGNQDHPNSPSKYLPYMHELNLKGLKFPLITKYVKKFERQNPTISVNILQWTGNQPLPLQVTEYRDRPHHVNLLLLHHNKTSKSIYTLARDLSRLVAGRTKAWPKTHVCPYCLYCLPIQIC